MTATTIKVDSSTRDRLKLQARAAGLTLGDHLATLADLADRRTRMHAMRDAMAASPADEMTGYLEESSAWDAVPTPHAD